MDGSYAALHRPNGATPFTRPQMWTAGSPDLLTWGSHRPLCLAGADWASGRVGAGAPPIPLGRGWLEIYHGNRRPTARGGVGEYVAAAVLLDRNDPSRILRQGSQPLFSPTETFERKGFVVNVVFPTGVIARGDSLLVYYGASDTYCAVAEISCRAIADLLDSG
jgi:predicted GH43/DUF377 family glycosyl hydrolase